MGVQVDPAFGRANSDLAEYLDCRLSNATVSVAAMQAHHFSDLEADSEGRVEAGHRLLENHADAVAAYPTQSAFAEPGKILTLEQNAAAVNVARRRRQKAQQRHGSYALATS